MGLPAGIETYFDPCVLNKLAYNHKYPPEDTRQKTEKKNKFLEFVLELVILFRIQRSDAYFHFL